MTFNLNQSECIPTGHAYQHQAFLPRASLPCQSELVQGLVAFFFCLSHIQTKAITTFKSCWEFIDGSRKIIFVYGGLLLLLHSFSLENEERKDTPQYIRIYGKVCSTEGKEAEILTVTEVGGICFLVIMSSISISRLRNYLKYYSFFTFHSSSQWFSQRLLGGYHICLWLWNTEAKIGKTTVALFSSPHLMRKSCPMWERPC